MVRLVPVVRALTEVNTGHSTGTKKRKKKREPLIPGRGKAAQFGGGGVTYCFEVAHVFSPPKFKGL